MPRRKKIAKVKVIEVTILPIGGEKKVVGLDEGASVEDAIEAAGLDPEGAEARINGDVVDLDDEVNDKEIIVLLTDGKIEGGI